MNNKAKFFIAGLFFIFVIFLVSYLLGLSVKLDNKNGSVIVSFVVEHSHTGLINVDMSQVALKDQDKTGSRLAANIQNNAQGNQVAGAPAVAVDNAPVVLFDISIRPIFEKNNTLGTSLLLIGFLIIFMYAINLLYKIRRKSKLKKAFKK